jgi:hypothetical protein
MVLEKDGPGGRIIWTDLFRNAELLQTVRRREMFYKK